MIIIKINIKIVILSFIIAILMYPKTFDFLINSGKDIYIAKKLTTNSIQNTKTTISSDKTSIVFMFDGGWSSVYLNAYHIFKEYDYKGSIQIIPSLVDEKEYMSYEQLAELYLEGWNLLNHSYSHKENTYVKSDELLSDFNKARQWMINRYIGKYSDMVVMPYGEINPYLIDKLKKSGYRNIRTSDNIIILNENEIKYHPVTVINLLTNVTVTEVKRQLTQTFKEHKTIVFTLNKIGDTDNGFGMTYNKNKLQQILMFINKNSDKFEVITYSELHQ